MSHESTHQGVFTSARGSIHGVLGAAGVLFLAFFVAAGSSFGAQAGFNFENEKSVVWRFLAGKHADLGKELVKAGLFLTARDELERALTLIPEYPDAMRALGYRQKGRTWEEGELISDKDQPVNAKAEAEAREKYAKNRKRLNTDALQKLVLLAKRCQSAGLVDQAQSVYAEALFYDREHKEANAALGFEKINGKWVRKLFHEARERGRRLLEAAGEGEKIPGEDEQGKTIGVAFFRRAAGPLVCRTPISDARCARLLKVSSAAVAVSQTLLGTSGEPPFREGRGYTLTVLPQRAQYESFVKNFGAGGEAQKQLALKLDGSGQATPRGYIVLQSSDVTAEDMGANMHAIAVLSFYRGSNAIAPWIDIGFGYLVTEQTLGTILITKYTVVDERRTKTRRKGPDDIRSKSLGADKFRVLIRSEVSAGDDVPLAELSRTGFNDFSESHAAKAYSLFEYFFEVYPEQTRVWLKLKPVEGARELEQLGKTFGKIASEIENDWRAWVLRAYP